jgi:hypothetical protein
MRCWAVEIELGGRVYEIPALPAVEWWPVLTSGDLNRVLDFVESTPDDPHNVDDLLLSGELSAESLVEVLTGAVEETAGRSFHAALVLATVANNQWAAIGGSLAQTGFRWDEQSLSAALDAVYSLVVERLDKDALKRFSALLENDTLTTGKRDRKRVVNEFEAVAGPRPKTGVVATGERSGSERPRTQLRHRRRHLDVRSVSPRTPHAGRAGSGPGANSVRLEDADGPASGTVLPPPPSGR